jgi:hypothetical protein
MLFDPKHEKRLRGLEERLCHADALTLGLVSDVIAQACSRFAAHSHTARARINRLIESGAWTDAALALVELELPCWKLRRLVYEDGEWLCSFSNQPRLPLGLDELAEASHEVLPLAILIAFLRAREAGTGSAVIVSAVPQVRAAESCAICCDNFS